MRHKNIKELDEQIHRPLPLPEGKDEEAIMALIFKVLADIDRSKLTKEYLPKNDDFFHALVQRHVSLEFAQNTFLVKILGDVIDNTLDDEKEFDKAEIEVYKIIYRVSSLLKPLVEILKKSVPKNLDGQKNAVERREDLIRDDDKLSIPKELDLKSILRCVEIWQLERVVRAYRRGLLPAISHHPQLQKQHLDKLVSLVKDALEATQDRFIVQCRLGTLVGSAFPKSGEVDLIYASIQTMRTSESMGSIEWKKTAADLINGYQNGLVQKITSDATIDAKERESRIRHIRELVADVLLWSGQSGEN